jgi:3-isopropylmalate/(R)-2-methylmalate dehydratase small subunit
LLPVQVSDSFLKKVFAAIEKNPQTMITVDLSQQKIVLEDGSSESFEINPYKKTCLMNGYDDIDYLLSLRDEIKHFELAH